MLIAKILSSMVIKEICTTTEPVLIDLITGRTCVQYALLKIVYQFLCQNR